MQKITPCLWFDDQAEEAVNFYTSLFPDSEIGTVSRYDEAAAKESGRPAGSVLTIEFKINGQWFIALNGGPIFKFTEAVSFMIDCKDQAEVDRYWDAMTADGGEESQCGWLKDKFGLSWQVAPSILQKWLNDPDKKKAARVMEAMLKMRKIDIQTLQDAYDNK